jgi:hypothetical protein
MMLEGLDAALSKQLLPLTKRLHIILLLKMLHFNIDSAEKEILQTLYKIHLAF